MRLKYIELLDTILREGSLSAAAQAMNLSQPALSIALKQAEGQIGYPLFLRRGGRLKPTAEALRLAELCREVMLDAKRVGLLASNLGRGAEAVLRIGAVPALSFEVVPQSVCKLLEVRPDTQIRLSTLSHTTAHELLASDEIDVAVMFGAPHPKNRLITETVGLGSVVSLIPEGLMSDSISLPKLISEYGLIGINDSGPLGELIDTYLLEQDISIVPDIATKTYYAASHFVRAGKGVALVDVFTARFVAQHSIEVLRLPQVPTIDITLSYRSASADQSIILAFIDELKAMLGSMPSE